MTDESRWWLRGEAVIDEGKAGRKDHDGQELQFFDVLVDSKIMVESLRPVSAGALKRLGARVSPEQLRDLVSGSVSIADHSDSEPWGTLAYFGDQLWQSIDWEDFAKDQ
jgi:hypothetical protein